MGQSLYSGQISTMMKGYVFTVQDRFLKYVTINTQSDPQSKSMPSTAHQKDLGHLLVQELQDLGLTDALLSDKGYVYATLPATTTRPVPVICFCAHLDTAPDCSGAGVKPLVHENYDGSDCVLPDDPSQVITTNDHPYLKERIGDTLITASGTTLLGADDKAGIAIIMDLVHYLTLHPELERGTIKMLFTPDEEVGRGVDGIDWQQLGAEVAYTLDGGERGSIEDENFAADGVTLTIYGVSAHPGAAKGKMVNALKVAAHLLQALPADTLSPESTEGRQGFVHPVQLEGTVEKATLEFIIRDFDTAQLRAYEIFLREILAQTLLQFPGARAEFLVREQYRNMKEILDRHPRVVDFAIRAIEMAGCTPKREGIRGGTDGARLSFMGLPCPNLFTGEMALHSRQEYVSVQDMQKSVETLLHLVCLWATEGAGSGRQD